MPLYFFDITEGVHIPDATGVMLPNTEAARVRAIAYASDLLRDGAAKAWIGEDWLIEVKDDLNSVLFTLGFTAKSGPGVAPRPTRTAMVG
jgi:hypothetical protein